MLCTLVFYSTILPGNPFISQHNTNPLFNDSLLSKVWLCSSQALCLWILTLFPAFCPYDQSNSIHPATYVLNYWWFCFYGIESQKGYLFALLIAATRLFPKKTVIPCSSTRIVCKYCHQE